MRLNKDFTIGILFKILYLSILIYSTIEMITGGLSLSYSRMAVLLFLVCYNIVVLTNIKYFRIATFSLLFLVLYVQKEELIKGLQVIINEIQTLLDQYYGLWLNSLNITADADLTLFLMLCAVIISYISRLAVLSRKCTWLLFLPGGLFIAGNMILGMMPPIETLFMYMIGGIGTCLTFRKHENEKLHNHIMLFVSGLMALLVIISVYVVYPLFEPSESELYVLKSEITEFYKDKNLYLYKDDAGSGTMAGIAEGGLAKGDLRNASSLRFSGKKHLEVSTLEKPEKTLYLKGFVAGNFEDGQWQPNHDAHFNQLLSDQEYNPENAKRVIWNMQANKLSGTLMPGQIEIKNLGVEAVIYPYAATLGIEYSFSSDENVERDDWSGDTFEYYPQFYQELTTYINEVDLSIRESYIQDLPYLYYEYVMASYVSDSAEAINEERWLEIDKYVSDGLAAGEYDSTVSALTDLIRSYLDETTSYNLAPGKVPDGQSFLDYFLFENKRGFCVHYASAATIMLRNYGVPARYVEGYVVTPGAFKENADGTYTAVVKDNSAHAWTEVFDYEYGWIPVEVTPSYSTAETTEKESDNEPKDTKAENVQETKAPRVVTETKKDNLILPYLLAAVVTIMLITLLIMIRRWVIVRRRHHQLYNKDNTKSVIACYKEIIKLYKFQSSDDEALMSEEAFAQKVEDGFATLEEGEFKLLTEIVLKAAYSPHEPTNTEKAHALKLYIRVRKEVTAVLGLLRKLRLLWVNCL